MIDLNALNLDAVVRHYMLANTPRYLYRHLRAEPSLEALAAGSTPAELLAAVSGYEQKPARTVEDVATAYALLVALSFQDNRSVHAALAQWHPGNVLAWTGHIVSIISQPVIVTTVTNRTAPMGRLAPDWAMANEIATPHFVLAFLTDRRYSYISNDSHPPIRDNQTNAAGR